MTWRELRVGSDSREPLVNRAYDSFEQVGYSQLAAIECDSHGSTIVLRGNVSSYYLKQIAQSIVKNIPGVQHVTNEIEVVEEMPLYPR